MLEFVWKWAFVALPLPLLYRLMLEPVKQNISSLRVPFYARAKASAGSVETQSINKLTALFLGLSWCLLVASAANPKIVSEPIELDRSGRDLMLAVDISGSMSTADMVYDRQRFARIVVVKSILEDFLEKRAGDRVGLILFGTNAYLQAPLTFDLETISTYLRETTLRLAGEKTAIGDAIGLAIKRLKDRPENQRVLILLTDGANTAGAHPRDTVEMAKVAGVKIYTVGVAAEGLTRSIFQSRSSDLDEFTLQLLADETGGRYFRARSPEELVKIYNELDQLESIKQDGALFRPEKSIYYYPLFASVLVLLMALSTRYFLSREA